MFFDNFMVLQQCFVVSVKIDGSVGNGFGFMIFQN